MASLHHIALGARDIDRLAEFYSRAFALVEITRHHTEAGALRSVWLALDDAVLMIELTENSARRVEGVGSGPFLLAFAIDGEDREENEVRLTSLGAPPESRTEFTSYHRDPEGNRVALSSYRR